MGSTENREAPLHSTTVPLESQNKALDTTSDTTAEPEGPFEPSEPSLLVIEAKVSGIRARFLIGDGAELNHISQDFCQGNGIALKEEQRTASMANNTPQQMMSTIAPIPTSLGVTRKRCALSQTLLNMISFSIKSGQQAIDQL